jgi:hypothetical protein
VAWLDELIASERDAPEEATDASMDS